MKKLKKTLFILSVFVLMLVSSLYVSAENVPITHTYLVSNDGDYVFETIVSSPTHQMYKPIVAMYDSKGALCGLTVEENLFAYGNKHTPLTISVSPWKTPAKVKFMLWNTSGEPVPATQFEDVPLAVCNEDFGSVANIKLTKVQSKQYTFETVFNSPATADYDVFIRMYDASGNVCGFYKGDSIPLVADKPVLRDITVNNVSSVPTKICFTLKNGADVVQFTSVDPTLSTEKFGFIMGYDEQNGVKLFTSDGTYENYKLADSFILSHGSNLVTDKTTAVNYINSLRFESYNRYADKDANGKYTRVWTPQYDWLLFFGENERYSKATPASEKYYYMNHSDNICKYSEFLNNYAKRMTRVLITSDSKIASMAFADDTLYKSATSGQTMNGVYYNTNTKLLGETLQVKDDATIIYLPAISRADESYFKAVSPSWLNSYDDYKLKNYTLANGKQIILVTYKFSDTLTTEELASYNADVVKNINITLYGVGGTQEKPTAGIYNKTISVNITPSYDNPNRDYIINTVNDEANKATKIILENVTKGLLKALDGAANGALLNKTYIKTVCADEIAIARENVNTLKDFDKNLGTDYYEVRLLNGIGNVVPNEALAFLEDYFL